MLAVFCRSVVVAILVVISVLAGPSTKTAAATCTSSVGPGIPAPTSLPSGIPGFHAAWYGQSGYPTLCPGDKATSVVAYYNSGSQGWVQGRMGEVAYLGTWSPSPGQDQPTPLGGDGTNGSPNTGWPRYNRLAIQPASYVGPGQVAWFQFTIQAPQTPGYYKLYLRPLVEGSTWMEDYGVFWQVTVLNTDGTYPPIPPPQAQPGCRDWPIQFGSMIAKVPLSPEVCLLPYEPRPDLCPSVGGCYLAKGLYQPGNVAWARNTVWIVRQPYLPEVEPHYLAHELCHSHQHWETIQAGLPSWTMWASNFVGYPPTMAGSEFVATWNSFRTEDPQGYSKWNEDRGQDFENGAEVCASWYFPLRNHDLSLYPLLSTWAQKWLPK